MCMFVYMYIYATHLSWHLWRSEEGIKSPSTRVTNGCEPSCEYWEPNLGLNEKNSTLDC